MCPFSMSVPHQVQLFTFTCMCIELGYVNDKSPHSVHYTKSMMLFK